MSANHKFSNTHPGFGLLEALIASGIIVMVSAASVGLAQSIIKSTSTFNDRIVADNLASEALEAAHWMRDYYINDTDVDTPWDRGFTKDNAGSPLSCAVDDNAVPCDIFPVNKWNNNLYFKDKDPVDSSLKVNQKDYVRKVWVIKDSKNSNIYKIHVKVFSPEDLTASLADAQTVIANWKEPQI